MSSTTAPGLHVDGEFVRAVLGLAKVAVSEARLPALVAELREIVTLISRIPEPVKAAVPMDGRPGLTVQDLRPDVPGPTLTRREISSNAPAHDGAFLVVPKFHGEGA